VNRYRNQNAITVYGKNVPDPARSFEDFKVDQTLVENLKKCGYTEPTPIQMQAVPTMLEVSNCL